MSLLGSLRTFFALRKASRQGAAAGSSLADSIEEAWTNFKALSAEGPTSPREDRARFIGWMKALYAHLAAFFEALKVTDADFAHHWKLTAATYCDRFYSEVLLPLYGQQAATVLSAQDRADILDDVGSLAARIAAQARNEQEAELDNAVRAIREAEQRGDIGADPRTDEEVRESIREMWNDNNYSD